MIISAASNQWAVVKACRGLIVRCCYFNTQVHFSHCSQTVYYVLKLNEVFEMLKNESCIVGGAVTLDTFHGARADDGDFFT